MSTHFTTSETWSAEPFVTGAPPRMTGEEFEQWARATEVRAEWVNGEVILMSPASVEHSDLNAWFATVLRAFVKRRQLGRALGPDFLVRLPGQQSRRIPDVLFVRRDREALIHRTVLDGAPDLALEVVSPDSTARDWREKYLEYEAAGVEEYWIVDPSARRIEAYTRGPESKFARIDPAGDRIASVLLPDFYVRPAWLWGDEGELRDPVDALAELGILPTTR